MRNERVVVVGAGPAGLAASSQLRLYGITPLVFECDEPGGLLLNACSVFNYPGVSAGISGRDIVKLFEIPEKLTAEKVTAIYRQDKQYIIQTDSRSLSALSVIIASGTVPVEIPLCCTPDSTIHYSVKDITFVTGGTAAVVGGGDVALDYALSLSRHCNVNVYGRSDFTRVVPHLLKKVRGRKNISLYPGSLQGRYIREKTIVVAAGRMQRTDFVSDKLLSFPPADGSFHMCGDCRNGIYRQAVIAAGNGVEAAMKVVEFLKKNTLETE